MYLVVKEVVGVMQQRQISIPIDLQITFEILCGHDKLLFFNCTILKISLIPETLTQKLITRQIINKLKTIK